MDNDNQTTSSDASKTDFLKKIQNYLLQYYYPATTIGEAEFHLTTLEVFDKLFSVFPFPDLFNSSIVAGWLHDAGFIFEDFGEMRFEWLFKRNP